MLTSRKEGKTEPPAAAPTTQRRRLQGRTPALALAGAGVVILAIASVVASRQGGGTNSSPVDGALKPTADRTLPEFNHAKRTLPISDSSLRSFQAWYYDTGAVFKRLANHPGPRFEDLSLFAPQTPPVLHSLGSPVVVADAATLNGVVKTGKPALTTVQQGRQSYRVYVAPLELPRAPEGTGSYMVLQVAGAT